MPTSWGVRLPGELRILVFGGFLVAVGYGIVVPALPALAVSMGGGVTAVSIIVGAFALARVIGAPWAAWLTRGGGAVRTFRGGLVVVALSSAACAIADGYSQLLVFRALGGIGSTMFTVAAATLIVGLAPREQRGGAFAAWSTGFLLGSTIGPALGGVLVTISPRAPFLAYAAVLLVTAAAAADLHVHQTRPVVARPGPLVGFAEACRDPAFRAALTSNFAVGWTVYGVRIAVVPLYVTEVLGESTVWSGIVLAAFGAGTVVALPLGGRLADRVGRRSAALAGSALVTLATALLVVDLSVVGLAALAALSGAGSGLVTPAANAAVADVVARRGGPVDGSAVAGFQAVGDVGAIVGPVVTGVVVGSAGYSAGFVLTASVVSLSGLAWLRSRDTSPGAQPS